MGDLSDHPMEYMGDVLNRAQDDLYRMMSIVGFEFKCPGNIKPISETDVEFLETEMNKYEKTMQDLSAFIRPGTTETAARLNIARTVCRRAERRMVEMMAIGGGHAEVSKSILKYINRLSDLLFVLAYQFEER